ncbi:hypothetical protein NECID01_1464 [Nematocida sp. AWRm77]|nr:hypothetical protein NECID01_1464 [Nematocida sp. AWRm77]
MKKAGIVLILASGVFGFLGKIFDFIKTNGSLAAASVTNPAILLGNSYEGAGGPSSGFLYNYGGHGYISKPSGLFSALNLMNAVGVSTSDGGKRVPIRLYKPTEYSLGYGIKIDSEVTEKNIFGDDIGKEKILGVNKLTFMLTKKKIKNNDDVDLFNLPMDPVYTDYFRIIYYGLCATPKGENIIIFTPCLSPDKSPDFINQLWKVVSDVKSEPIFVPKGISPFYFEGTAPCTRSIPDANKGNFFLLNEKYCNNSCLESKPQSNPTEFTPGALR